MRKIILSLSLIAIVALGTACSSDDNSGPKEQNNTKTLVLAASSVSVTVDEEVQFTVTDGSNSVAADIYLNETVVGNSMKFNSPGEFKFVAKKAGYKDSNIITVIVSGLEETSMIIGSWVPQNVLVTLPMASPMDIPYPHQADCDKDILTFKKEKIVEFNVHNELCEATPTGTNWELNEATSMLKFSLFGQEMNVKVEKNTENELVVSAKADQFQALIPILIPDMDMDQLGPVLPMIDIQLKLTK